MPRGRGRGALISHERQPNREIEKQGHPHGFGIPFLAPCQCAQVTHNLFTFSQQSGKLSSRFKRGVFSSGSQRKKSKDELFAPESWVKLDLEKQAALDHHDIPLIIHLCIEAIDKRGLSTPELYRISGRSSTVKILRVELISGNPPSLDDEQYADINIITSVLKQYLQDIPKPVISTESYSEFLASLSERPPFFFFFFFFLPFVEPTLRLLF